MSDLLHKECSRSVELTPASPTDELITGGTNMMYFDLMARVTGLGAVPPDKVHQSVLRQGEHLFLWRRINIQHKF